MFFHSVMARRLLQAKAAFVAFGFGPERVERSGRETGSKGPRTGERYGRAKEDRVVVGGDVGGVVGWGPSAWGQEAEERSGLGVTADVTWVSKYVWRGYDLFDDHAAFQPSVDADLLGRGLV